MRHQLRTCAASVFLSIFRHLTLKVKDNDVIQSTVLAISVYYFYISKYIFLF